MRGGENRDNGLTNSMIVIDLLQKRKKNEN